MFMRLKCLMIFPAQNGKDISTQKNNKMSKKECVKYLLQVHGHSSKYFSFSLILKNTEE